MLMKNLWNEKKSIWTLGKSLSVSRDYNWNWISQTFFFLLRLGSSSSSSEVGLTSLKLITKNIIKVARKKVNSFTSTATRRRKKVVLCCAAVNDLERKASRAHLHNKSHEILSFHSLMRWKILLIVWINDETSRWWDPKEIMLRRYTPSRCSSLNFVSSGGGNGLSELNLTLFHAMAWSNYSVVQDNWI